MRLLLSAQGEIKSKASIIIYHGEGGERERMKGGSHGFQGNRGGETVIANKVQRGGYRTLPANGGDHSNTTKLWRGGGTRLISG